MSNKELKEVMRQYIETQTDHILSETEKYDLTSLDKKVYETINTNQNKRKTSGVWSYRKISVLAASIVLIVGLGISTIFILHKEPAHIAQDVYYTITISYKNEQYGFYSNKSIIDKYGLDDIPDSSQSPDLFTETLNDTDIIQLDSIIDRESIIGAKIYPYSNEVIILQCDEQIYYFEKISES